MTTKIQTPVTASALPRTMQSTYRLWGGEMTVRVYLGESNAVMIVTAIDGTCESRTSLCGIDPMIWVAGQLNNLASKPHTTSTIELVAAHSS